MTRPVASSRAWNVRRRRLFGLVGSGLGMALLDRAVRIVPGEAAGETTLIVGEQFDISSIDPARDLGVTGYEVRHALYDTLTTFAGMDIGHLRPSLAKTWTISPDGKRYTFTLRSNLTFASGNPLTSADVKWSLDRAQNVKAITEYLVSDVVEEIQAPSPDTVVVVTKAPKPSILSILSNPSLCVLDSKLVTQNGGDASPDAKSKDNAEAYLNSHSVGTGPFTLSRYTPSNEIVLVKNPRYWGGPARVDRVVIRNIAESASEQLELGKGSIDVALSLGQSQADALRSVSGVTVKATPTATTFWLAMHNDPAIGGPFANPKVQQAVRYALDYDGIVKIAGRGALRLTGLLSPLFPGALPSRDAMRSDPAKARALLKEANVNQVSGKLSYPAGEVRFSVQEDVLVQKIQADLAKVGINIALNGNTRQATAAQARAGKAQFLLWTWAADYPDQDDFLFFVPGRLLAKRSAWMEDSSPQAKDIAALARQAETSTDAAARTALYTRIDRGLQANGPFVPLFVPAVPYAYRNNITGVTNNPIWEMDFRTVNKA